MIKELLLCIEKEEKQKELDDQVKLRRNKMNYLVNYLCITVKSKKNKWVFITLTVFLAGCQLGIFMTADGTVKDVLTSILAPFIIASIVSIPSAKMVIESKISDIEKEMLDICVFIETYDKLQLGEKYILNYLNDFGNKKYTKKNEFKKEEALK